jgi:hypothetical protein
MESLFDYSRVAVHGVPRSGTSWIGEILNSSPNTIYRYQPLFSYAHKEFLTNSSTREDIYEFFNRLASCKDSFTNQINKRDSGDLPKFSKKNITHIIYKEVRYINILFNMMRKTEDVFLCAVIRNPISVINSWLKAPREFRRDLGWSELEEWRYSLKKNLNRPEEYNGYEKWKEAANIFIQLKKTFPQRVYLLKYSELLKNPIQEAKNIFTFLNLNFSKQTEKFIYKSTNFNNHDPYSVYRQNKNEDNNWKTELNPIIFNQIVDDIKNTHLETFIENL